MDGRRTFVSMSFSLQNFSVVGMSVVDHSSFFSGFSSFFSTSSSFWECDAEKETR